MNSNQRTFTKSIVYVFIVVSLGLLVGGGAGKYTAHGAGQTVIGQPTGTAPDAPVQGLALDTLFPGTQEAWDPFRQMSELQAEIARAFQGSNSRFGTKP